MVIRPYNSSVSIRVNLRFNIPLLAAGRLFRRGAAGVGDDDTGQGAPTSVLNKNVLGFSPLLIRQD